MEKYEKFASNLKIGNRKGPLQYGRNETAWTKLVSLDAMDSGDVAAGLGASPVAHENAVQYSIRTHQWKRSPAGLVSAAGNAVCAFGGLGSWRGLVRGLP